MSNAELIFQRLQENGYSEVERMIQEQQEENVFIDFKLKSDHSTHTLSKDDKKNYAKALSGFANTAGGVIVWGVDASKNENGVDAANDQKPIANARAFLTQLNSLLSDSLTPLVSGVQNFYIPLPGQPENGFVITYVPASDLPPHRALLSVNQYCMRVGDSFVTMEHSHLEDAFGRRQRPVLEIYYEIESGAIYGGISGKREFECEIVFGIRNVGRYVATYPAIRVQAKENLILLEVSRRQGLDRVYQTENDKQKNGYMFVGSVNDVIHPGSYKAVYSLTTRKRINESYIYGSESLPEDSVFSFSYEIFAQGCEPVQGEVIIPFEEVKQALQSGV